MMRNQQRRGLRVKAAIVASVASVAFVEGDAAAQEPTAQNYKMVISEVEQTYGLNIREADAPFEIESNSGAIRGRAVSPADLVRYVPLFAKEFFLYPPEFVAALKLRRIVLCRDLSYRRESRAGVPDIGCATLYFDVALPWPNRRYQCTVIHHEIFHLFDYADDGMLFEDVRWLAINPPGFEYARESRKGDDPKAAEFSRATDGLLTRYCLTGVEEDKAEVFSHLVVDGRYVVKRAEAEPVLKAKVVAIKRMVKVFCKEMDDAFWQSANRLARPGPEPPEPRAHVGEARDAAGVAGDAPASPGAAQGD